MKNQVLPEQPSSDPAWQTVDFRKGKKVTNKEATETDPWTLDTRPTLKGLR